MRADHCQHCPLLGVDPEWVAQPSVHYTRFGPSQATRVQSSHSCPLHCTAWFAPSGLSSKLMYQSSIFLPAFLVTEETKGGKAKSNEKGVGAATGPDVQQLPQGQMRATYDMQSYSRMISRPDTSLTQPECQSKAFLMSSKDVDAWYVTQRPNLMIGQDETTFKN